MMKYALKSILSLISDKVASEVIEAFNPRVYYKTRDGLWVGDFFRDNVLSKAGAVTKLPAALLKSFELTKNAYDREITSCLPQNYEFDISETLARIAQMIERQPGGKEGDLLNNGYVNLFYVPGYVVNVNWTAVSRRWRVNAWKLDVNDWFAGDRVFVRG